MVRTYSDFEQGAIEQVRQLWHMYIVNPEPEQLEGALSNLPPELLMIGTGRHEMYKNRDEFLAGMTEDQIEARDIRFELQDEWYEAQKITEDVCVVFGSIWVREKASSGKAVLVDMEGSRFTVVCRNAQNGIEICSVHHSMPYIDQGEDEYYPKSLATLANEAVQKSKALERRVELDHMTELYNRTYMEWHVSQTLKSETGFFYIFDLDEFKAVNDSMGHLAGDKVIQEFARLLKRIFAPSAILGRMGGDEFAVWDSSISGEREATARFDHLSEECRKLSVRLKTSVSCSAGIAVNYRTGENFSALYQRADQALYRAKAHGRNGFCWAENKAIE
ncbi:MAG: diguanylate cyclase domain-containing protein [Oscillospiraceae bacterium]|jgi:diguanylate cyclase (GGDEF)-like protein